MHRTVVSLEQNDLKEVKSLLSSLHDESVLRRKLQSMLNQNQTAVQVTEEEIEEWIDALPLQSGLRPQLVAAMRYLRIPSRAGVQ